MKQESFEARYGSDWDTFQQWMSILSSRKSASATNAMERSEISQEFPALFRRICHHLSLARARRYSIGLQQKLNQLALDGHRHLYRPRTTFLRSLMSFFKRDFPLAFRAHLRFMLTSTALFVLPAVGMAIAVYVQPELIYAFMDPHQIAGIEKMYDPANNILGRERQSDSDLSMFGFYIYNNISVGFRTLAGGLLFGIGSVFFLCFNGLFMGAISTHLTTIGYSETFWPFVLGHSALELTAIVLFGGIGLSIGFSAIAPRRKGRWQAIQDCATESMPLIYGGTAMLILAAFVEAFWSSTTWPPSVYKIAVGGLGWLLVIAYFGLMGRGES